MSSQQPPLVSICIPTYNGARWLDDALQSALAQDYRPIEIVVVDDASTDESLRILTDVRDPLLRVVRNRERLGLQRNLDRAVGLAKGQWIKFLFQDDMIAPECVSRMMAVADDGNRIVVCGRTYEIADDVPRERVDACADLVARSVHSRHPGRTRLSPIDVGRDVGSSIDLNIFGEPVSWLVQRACFDDFGGFDSRLAHLLDLEWLLRAATNVGMALVPEPLATFRVHAESETHRNYSQRRFLAQYGDRVTLRMLFAASRYYGTLRHTTASLNPPVFFDYLATQLLDEARACADPNDLTSWSTQMRQDPVFAGLADWSLAAAGASA